MRVRCNDFVKRQTPDSRFAHFEGSWEDLEDLMTSAVENDLVEPGYKDGVVLVPMNPSMFKSSVAKVMPGMHLEARVEARREKEDPVTVVVARGEKAKAKKVFVVLYRHDVLAENNEQTYSREEAEWEIISINATPDEEELPMTPIAMARNFLEKTGGTKGEYTAEQFAQAIWYWATHVMTEK